MGITITANIAELGPTTNTTTTMPTTIRSRYVPELLQKMSVRYAQEFQNNIKTPTRTTASIPRTSTITKTSTVTRALPKFKTTKTPSVLTNQLLKKTNNGANKKGCRIVD